jgi:hypothetical protein
LPPSGLPVTSSAVLHWRKRFANELDFDNYRGILRLFSYREDHGLERKKRQVINALSDLMRNPCLRRKVDGTYFMNDGKLYERRQGQAVEADLSPSDHDRVRCLLNIRDTVNDLIAAQLAGDPAKSAAHRQELVTAYQTFVKEWGPINKEVSTVTSRLNKAGVPVVVVRQPNLVPLLADPDVWKVAAIENYDRETGTAKPSDIQTKDVIAPHSRSALAGR